MNKKLYYLLQAALIASLYAVLTYAQVFIAPGTTSGPIQFRLSEALTVLSLFTPAAVPGLTVGCIIANIANISSLPLDVVVGSVATLVTAVSMRMLRNVRIYNVPLLSLLMPAVFNGIIIGAEIEIFFIAGAFNIVSFLLQAGCVAIGELVVCLVLGIPLYFAIKKSRLMNRYIFTEEKTK